MQVTSIQVNSVEVETVSRTWLKEHGIFNPSQHSGIASIEEVCLSNGESITYRPHTRKAVSMQSMPLFLISFLGLFEQIFRLSWGAFQNRAFQTLMSLSLK